MHNVMLTEPAGQKLPAVHSAQEATLIMPLPVWYVPLPQRLQLLTEIWPAPV